MLTSFCRTLSSIIAFIGSREVADMGCALRTSSSVLARSQVREAQTAQAEGTHHGYES
jgi:hypothetical protein